MTVCVAVRVNDGIVFAADSASSISITKDNGESEVINVYNNGLKVFNLYKRLPIAAMTCGMGSIGTLSIASLAKHLRFLLTHGDGEWKLNPDNYTIREVVDKAKRFLFEDRFLQQDPLPLDVFEFWIGGYPSDMMGEYELWKIVIAGGECGEPIALGAAGQPGLSWGGSHEPINRLLIGFDYRLRQALNDLLTPVVAEGEEPFPDDDARQRHSDHVDDVAGFIQKRTQLMLHSPLMPIQDAIEFARFLVETTKSFYRFLPGANIVGGDTDIAVVTRHEGFKWVQRKHYYESHLNRLETDHV